MKRQEPSPVHPNVIKAAAYFRKHRGDIKAAYPAQFVAILDGQIIAVDHDYGRAAELASRCYPARHAYVAYADALLLTEMLERFRIGEPITDDWREEAEEFAAEEFFRRMQND